MILQDYQDMSIELMEQPQSGAILTGLALAMTMRSDKEYKPVTREKCKFLIDAEHMSVFEHATFTFLIGGISRSLLAQITRHRTATITSGSQHYQDYSDYPCSVGITHLNNYDAELLLRQSLTLSTTNYSKLLALGQAREEARQVLPNASVVNILWTCDARNLFGFLRQRLCNRNVMEMRIFAAKLRVILLGEFPELFTWSGPQCAHGECLQERMQCKERTWVQV
jgi:thymidylate synthase (FAD)